MKKILYSFVLLLTGCLGYPEKIAPVENFNLQRYLGTWYEIARFDHSFERGLEGVSAEYQLRDDSGVSVVNRGYDTGEDEWQDAQGKAYFVERDTLGYLKVSFFGPFYSAYVVFELGDNYEYSFVTSSSDDYVWLLARTPEVSQALKDKFTRSLRERGYNPAKLIWVDQSRNVSENVSR